MKFSIYLVALSFLSVFLLSCEKEKKGNELGPQVEAVEIETAQNISLSKLDPYKIKQGQRVHKIETQESFTYAFKNVLALPQKNQEAIKSYRFKKKLAKTLGLSPLANNRKVTEAEIEGVSFHNLAKREVILVPPELVLESEDCRGLSPCEIKADLITYDIVFHLSDGSRQKHQLEWYISPTVPFFAGILKQCATTLVPIEDLRVLVKQCLEVVDFNH